MTACSWWGVLAMSEYWITIACWDFFHPYFFNGFHLCFFAWWLFLYYWKSSTLAHEVSMGFKSELFSGQFSIVVFPLIHLFLFWPLSPIHFFSFLVFAINSAKKKACVFGEDLSFFFFVLRHQFGRRKAWISGKGLSLLVHWNGGDLLEPC